MSETTEATTGAGSDGAIIKADRHGRARYDAAFRRRVLEAYASSGMSAMAFAGHCGGHLHRSTQAPHHARARRRQPPNRRDVVTATLPASYADLHQPSSLRLHHAHIGPDI